MWSWLLLFMFLIIWIFFFSSSSPPPSQSYLENNFGQKIQILVNGTPHSYFYFLKSHDEEFIIMLENHTF